MEDPAVNRRGCAVLYHQAVWDENKSYLEIRAGKTLAITLWQGGRVTFSLLEDLVKLKIEPKFALRPEKQLPQSHFLICNISLVWFISTSSVKCRCWHRMRRRTSLLLETLVKAKQNHVLFIISFQTLGIKCWSKAQDVVWTLLDCVI